VPLVTAQRVGAGTAVENIILRAAEDLIIPGAGGDGICARVPEELVVARAAGDGVAPALCVDQIVVVAQGWREPAELGCAGLCVVAIVIEEGREDRLENRVAVCIDAHLHEVIHFLKHRAGLPPLSKLVTMAGAFASVMPRSPLVK